VALKGNVQKMQETYNTFKANPDDDYSPSPTVAIVPNAQALKEVMSGLFCRPKQANSLVSLSRR